MLVALLSQTVIAKYVCRYYQMFLEEVKRKKKEEEVRFLVDLALGKNYAGRIVGSKVMCFQNSYSI